MLLEGRVVVVTGGARGIGGDVCRVLARHGARVVVNYAKSRERAEASRRRSAGGGDAFGADVRELSGYEALVAHAVETHGRLDGVVNNAIAGKQDGAFEGATDEDFATAFDFGCRAVANSVRAAMPAFREAGGGRIVNVVTELWNMGSGRLERVPGG